MPERLLEVRDLDAWYGNFQALFGVSVEMAPGQVVAIIGANGAGKSTLLNSIAGIVSAPPHAVIFERAAIGGMRPHAVAGRGIALVPEGRLLFPSLDVEENLLIGGQLGRQGPWTLARIFELFPVLAERRRLPPAALSGGEQQMLALGRALMSNPRLMLCDEMSLGLSPITVRSIYAQLPAIRAEGIALMLVEQDIGQALRAADYVYCMQEGRVALEGAAHTLTRENISQAYFGA